MADMTFLTDSGATIERKMMIAYLNTGEAGTPVWSAIGKRVEDSSDLLDDSKRHREVVTFSDPEKPKRVRREAAPKVVLGKPEAAKKVAKKVAKKKVAAKKPAAKKKAAPVALPATPAPLI